MSEETLEHKLAMEYITNWESKTPSHVITKCIKHIQAMFEEYKRVGIDKGAAWYEIEQLFYEVE